jgi:hypothetical protein
MISRATLIGLITFAVIGSGLYLIWRAQAEDALGELSTCQNQCRSSGKNGILVPLSITQIKRDGGFSGPTKCECT